MSKPDTTSNPFSTRFTRPGALEYLFATGETADSLVQRLREHGWRGAIVGPHGSGKSTLLASLAPAVARAGRSVMTIVLREGERRLPPLPAPSTSDEPTLLIIDGFEQLSWWSQWKLPRLIRRRGWGLLVTSHETPDLPVLIRTATTSDLASQLVARLLASREPCITHDNISTAFASSHGDLREMLFRLYDLYELRRPSGEL